MKMKLAEQMRAGMDAIQGLDALMERIANPHRVLGVKQNADPEDINKAWKVLARKYHPDRNQDNRAAAEEKMKEINMARDQMLAGDDGLDGRGGSGAGDYADNYGMRKRSYADGPDIFDFTQQAFKDEFGAGMSSSRFSRKASETDLNRPWNDAVAMAGVEKGVVVTTKDRLMGNALGQFMGLVDNPNKGKGGKGVGSGDKLAAVKVKDQHTMRNWQSMGGGKGDAKVDFKRVGDTLVAYVDPDMLIKFDEDAY